MHLFTRYERVLERLLLENDNQQSSWDQGRIVNSKLGKHALNLYENRLFSVLWPQKHRPSVVLSADRITTRRTGTRLGGRRQVTFQARTTEAVSTPGKKPLERLIAYVALPMLELFQPLFQLLSQISVSIDKSFVAFSKFFYPVTLFLRQDVLASKLFECFFR